MKQGKNTKMLKAANIIVTVALVLLIGGLLYSISIASIACFTSSSIKVSEVKEYYENEDIVVNITRPKVSGFSDKTFEKLLNEKIEYKILTDRNALELYSIDHDHHDQFYFEVKYYIKSSDGIFSLKVWTDFYYGYITDLPISIYYNVDIANNKLLTLDDLFNDDTYKTRLDAYLTSAITKKISENSAELFKGVSDKTKFFITNGKLYIAFAKYQIASGALNEPEFEIPTEEIKDLLKDEYKGIFN